MLSASSDKTIKLWDLKMHKVLKSWDYHKDSISCLDVSKDFTRFCSGSLNGELFLNDIKNNVYCNVDNLTSPINSVSLLNNSHIFTTSNSSIYEYVKILLLRI